MRLPMREAKIRSSSQAQVSDMAREKVLVLLGDSNFHYCPEETCLSTLLWSPAKSMGDMVRTQLPGRVILAYARKLAMKSWESPPSAAKSVLTSLDTLKSLCPDIEVHVLVLCGQNDALYVSRGSTPNFEDERVKFRNRVEKELKKLEEEIPYATIYWVKPFDDPTIYLEQPLYKVLVEELEKRDLFERSCDHFWTSLIF